MYLDGREVASATTKTEALYSAGDSRVVVGRYYTKRNINYASVQVDELIFFDRALTSDEVQSIYNSA